MRPHAPDPPSGKKGGRRRVPAARVATKPDPIGRSEADGPTPAISAQLARSGGNLSPKHVVALQRTVGNAAVGGAIHDGVIQRDNPAPANPGAKVKLDLGWLDLGGGGLERNEQVAAIARLGIASLEGELVDVESEQVKAEAKELIATVRGALPYFDKHGPEPIDAAMVPLINHQLDQLAKVRQGIQRDKDGQLEVALRAELRAAEEAAAQVEAMQPALDDAMRTAFRKGDASTVKDAVSTVKSALSIGRNIRSLAAGITSDINLLNMPVPAGTKMAIDKWSSGIGRVKVTIVSVNKYTDMLATLGRGLSGINIALTVADRSKRATDVEQGMKDLNDVVNVSTDLASLPTVGLPPHMSLMTTLYLKPALKVIAKQIGVLVDRLSDINKISVAGTGDLMYPNAEPGGQAMFDFMINVMHAGDSSGLPTITGAVESYLFDHREKLEAGTEEEIPTSGWWFWRDLDTAKARSWLFIHRRQVWAMFYGSMAVPSRPSN